MKRLNLRLRASLQFVFDMLLALVAWWVSFWLRFNLEIPADLAKSAFASSGWVVVAYGFGLASAKVYRQVWRYAGLPELRQLVLGVFIATLAMTAAVLMLRLPNFPRSVLLLQPLVALLLLGGARAFWRTLFEQHSGHRGAQPMLIVGSLQDASDALRALKGSQQWRPVGIVSPVPEELGRSLLGVPVLAATHALAARSGGNGGLHRAGCQPGRFGAAARGADAGQRRAAEPADDAAARRMAAY